MLRCGALSSLVPRAVRFPQLMWALALLGLIVAIDQLVGVLLPTSNPPLSAQERRSAHPRLLLAIAIVACASCAAECESHAGMHEHCHVCGEACRRCESACADLLTALG
jgi:hypothetical protein